MSSEIDWELLDREYDHLAATAERCGCCCSEHTFEHCPARVWGDCRGQGTLTRSEVESWATFYETAHGMSRDTFFGGDSERGYNRLATEICRCCCSEHTSPRCPARAYGGCRGQNTPDLESWAAFYEQSRGMSREVFFGGAP